MSPSPSKRQQEIVRAAVDLISSEGIQRVTMKKIAARLNITEPALYRHFASKMDILLAILVEFQSGAVAIRQHATALDAPAPEQMAALFQGFISRFDEQPTAAAVIFAEEIFQDDTRLAEAVRDLVNANQKALLNLIKRGQGAGEIRSDVPAKFVAAAAMGAFRLTVMRWRLSGHSFDLKHEGAALWRALQTMILPPSKSR